jgi:hypothetical protein
MLQIAVELATENPVYEPMAVKFYEHFLWIADAMMRGGGDGGLWDEEDGFIYDVLVRPDGSRTRLKVRSVVGLLAMCASTVFPPSTGDLMPEVAARMREFQHRHPRLAGQITHPETTGHGGRRLLALLTEERLRRVLRYMLDEDEFLSPFGIRSLSRFHLGHPYVFRACGAEFRVDYEPGESHSGMFGGNSNWRGPIWFPMNILIIRGLLNLQAYYGDQFKVECPVGSGRQMTLFEVAEEIARRLMRIFLRDEQGARPVHGTAQAFQADPHWRDLVLFYEYFHADTGAGLGASHQTGWTGLVAPLIQLFGRSDARGFIETEWRGLHGPASSADRDKHAHVA